VPVPPEFEADASLLAARAVVPEHVVHRDFADQSIALNLKTGNYHGLNPTAARMLEELGEDKTLEAAVPPLVDHFGQPREVIERDLLSLCRALAERGLIELHAGTD
jgi:hypothetical protein